MGRLHTFATVLLLAALPPLIVQGQPAGAGPVAPHVAATHRTEPQPRDYLALPLTADGQLPAIPYVWERRAGSKQLVVIGTRHSSDPAAPMHARIEAIFGRVQPQLVLHESSAPPGLTELPRDEAIRVGSDVGLAAVLARRHGAAMRSGDARERNEITALLRAFPANEVLVFLVAQRHIGNVNAPDLDACAKSYPALFNDYLAANGLPRRPGWETWSGFLREYRAVFGAPLTAASWDRSAFSAINRSGRLAQISRATNRVRDHALLTAIEQGLHEHDRVVVVFGGWHVLAIEPVLDRLLQTAATATPAHRQPQGARGATRSASLRRRALTPHGDDVSQHESTRRPRRSPLYLPGH